MLDRPIPVPDADSEPFWRGCAEGRLMLQHCGDHYQFPPSRFCTTNPNVQPEWAEVSGRGTVYSWIVVHVGIPRNIYGSQVPYVTALIALDAGPRICANLVDIDPGAVRAGMPVEIFFDKVADGSVTLPFFRPAAA
ncbi:Zn-ribbon domain-containing OB-fold protein [Sphingomonas sp.]|uniref:Zn-ribbon domain-containing OB-fold protein n=1 Tax=Sphingomonas sp. TaxID=28214 RepID=UPI003D6C90D9